jgi:hypothetical protein
MVRLSPIWAVTTLSPTLIVVLPLKYQQQHTTHLASWRKHRAAQDMRKTGRVRKVWPRPRILTDAREPFGELRVGINDVTRKQCKKRKRRCSS